ncbi:MAG: ThuA domain-containing protein [Planctomycetota bacterium]|nr:ThuA domain-containing protein [Planctomycetota bacterium]MDA1251534.1 ThuA domain-containing protein [Planctomycetota bacterium]
MRKTMHRYLAVAALACTMLNAGSAVQADLKLSLRSRVETTKESGRFHTVTRNATWTANETAIIVCDMWDLHHCLNATKRGAELAPRMDELLKKARSQGTLIIHAPSSCTEFYKDSAARKRAQATPRSKNLPDDIASWCRHIPSEEQGEYPIDQSDGGEDDDLDEHAEWAKRLAAMGRNPKAPWTRQTSLLTIDEEKDFISDNGEEIWSILETHRRQNVILLGVHTNMCVLGRPFGLRQMAKNGKNVVLCRDLTDTMYNPKMKPFVSHFTGTDLIVEHIEKWVCPTITSDQILEGKPLRFEHDTRPRLVIVTAEREYKTEETLPPFALKHLGNSFQVSFVFADADERNTLPGVVAALDDADVLLVSVRRRVLPAAQMAAIRRHVEAGKPIVGIRTANHAFSLRGKPIPDGLVDWESWDSEIIGGNYSNHHGDGPKVKVTVHGESAKHPILAGVDTDKLAGAGSLYVVSPLKKSATALLTGAIPGKDSEPIAWVNETSHGNRVFYTSLGHVGDFEQPAFNRLLSNAIHWAAGLPAEK